LNLDAIRDNVTRIKDHDVLITCSCVERCLPLWFRFFNLGYCCLGPAAGRPRGPSVTRTVSAIAAAQRMIFSRALIEKTIACKPYRILFALSPLV
jgi:hypothetical protein